MPSLLKEESYMPQAKNDPARCGVIRNRKETQMNSKKIFWMISLFLGSSLAFSQMGMAQTYGGSMTNPSYSYQTSDMKNLIGAKVINLQGEDLGKIADVTISPADNSQYLIVSPNLPQMNNQFVAVPYSLVSGQPTSEAVTVDLSKEHQIIVRFHPFI